MTEQYLNLVEGEWVDAERETALCDEEGNPFQLNVLLRQKLDILKNLVADNWDGMFIIDGRERSGKSNLAMTCAYYLTKGKMGIENVASGLNDVAKKIERLPDRSVLVLDEGSTMFSSKDSTGKAQKQLIKIFDVIGQKNMIFIICLPCFFDLNKTIAVRRSQFLIHVRHKELKSGWKREPFYYFNESSKGILYREGKKKYDSYKFPYPTFQGKYHKFKPPFWNEYEDILKKASMKEVLDDALGEGKNSAMAKRIDKREAKLMHYMKNKLGMSNEEIAEASEVSVTSVTTKLRSIKASETPKPLLVTA